MRGQIEVIAGCMFSGKTSALFGRIARAEALNQRWRLFKHTVDDRYGLAIVTTHNGLQRHAVMTPTAAAIMKQSDDVDLVAIDEGHFFDAGLPAACMALAESGRHVVITGLDLDSWGQPFPVMTELLAVAETSQVLRGVCAQCGGPACRTHRRTPIVNGRLVGGPEAYEPRCETCFTPPAEPAPPAPSAVIPQTGPAIPPSSPATSPPSSAGAASLLRPS